jgi:hypothetical protein
MWLVPILPRIGMVVLSVNAVYIIESFNGIRQQTQDKMVSPEFGYAV